MVPLTSLWLPILLGSVLVFLVSSVVHMMLKHHRNDFAPLPNEDAVRAQLRAANIAPGDYYVPLPGDQKAMKSPEYQAKLAEGPVAFMTFLPNGSVGMGSSLIQWLLYTLVISVFVAYLTGRTVGAGVEYMTVFRVAGTVAFLGYAGAQPVQSIWGKRKWSTTWKHVGDGFLYALVTAGAFAGFWPEG